MPPDSLLRFIARDDVQVEELPWGPHAWISRPGLTDAEKAKIADLNWRIVAEKPQA